MEHEQLTAKAATWMQAGGWKRKLAKQCGCEQSLFEHTLIEADALTFSVLTRDRNRFRMYGEWG